jgi:hypothetical protein
MPCTSTAQAEDELLDMLIYDTVLSALHSSSSSEFVPNNSEFDLNTHDLQKKNLLRRLK